MTDLLGQKHAKVYRNLHHTKGWMKEQIVREVSIVASPWRFGSEGARLGVVATVDPASSRSLFLVIA